MGESVISTHTIPKQSKRFYIINQKAKYTTPNTYRRASMLERESSLCCFFPILLKYIFRFMVLNGTFNNTSVISWWSVLFVEETRVPGENHGHTDTDITTTTPILKYIRRYLI